MSKVKFLVAVVLSVLVAACSEEENLSQAGKTGFHVSLTEDVKVDSRSTPKEIGKPAVSNFKLKITRQSDGLEAYNGSYTATIPAPVGMYTLEATHGDNPVLALDAPYYEGRDTAEVKEDELTEVEISCKVANALASVVFDDNNGVYKFSDQFSSYGVKVAVPDTAIILRDGDGRSAYYRAGTKPVFTFEGTLKDGTAIEPVLLENEKLSADTTFAAGQHCIIKLKLGATSSGVRVEISKVEVKKETISETIPMEWLPKPKVTATGFDESNTLTFVETEQKQAALNLNLSSALQDMKLKFNFQDEQFATLDKEKTYQLSVAEDKAAIETALGITLPNVGDKPESIDLSNLLAKIQTNAGVPTTNTIEIDAKANNRWSSEVKEGEEAPNLKYTLTCNKPVFRVDAYPGNIWTKEFTMNALREEQVESGDFAKISGNIKYQYSTNGEDNWTDLGDGFRQANLTPGTTYYIRGLYRDAVPSEVTEVKTYPVIELENGDMEDWDYTDGPEASWPSKGPFWKRWYVRTNKDESTDGWCSLNYYTTSNNDPKAYCSNSGTEQSSDKHTGNYAAEIKTIGWGDGTTAASPISTIKENTPGELFLGKITNNEREYGISYESRPTNLVFWYKYQPEGSHEFTAKIVIENKNKNIILAEEIFNGNKQDSYVEKNIPINYKEEYKHIAPTHMYVLFSSGENTNSEVDKASITRGSRHVGNILYIDDIQLTYDK